MNTQISNFTRIYEYRSDELDCLIQMYEHNTLKTRVIALLNDDPNMCFCAGYKTPPGDSTGVPHILEHSVLSGSTKYPVKDVFSELVKGSLTTFLNAMTYSDKTLYPFSTRNPKEYFNLMDVYLDLTLNPLLDEDTFMQEGWHYKLKDKDSALQYNGIVLNEMKGVFSDPVRKMWEKITFHLMPGSTYANCSGGNPDNIPDLTYEAFKEFHKKYYHPSNSAVAVYGDVPIEKVLEKLDVDFLQKFSYSPGESKILVGEKIKEPREVFETYESDENALGYLGMGVTTGEVRSVEDNISMEILTNLLLNSEASILKRDLLKAGAGSEIGCIYNDTYLSFLFLYIIGSNEQSPRILKETYQKTLLQIVKEGFSTEFLLSEINSFEFSKRELNSSAKRGMDFTLEAMSAYMYGLDVKNSIELGPVLDKIRKEALENRYFEKLIEERLLNNDQQVLYCMTPKKASKSKKDKEPDKETIKLKTIKESLDEDALNEIMKKAATLEKKQKEPTPEENLKLLPRLALSDISPKFEPLPIRVSSPQFKGADEGVKSEIIITENKTNGINYFNIGFSIDHLEPKYLPYVTLFGQIMTEIGTKKRNYVEIAEFTNTYTGGFSSDYANYSHKEDPQYSPYLWFHMKFLDKYTDQAFDLLQDILTSVDFSDKTRLSEVIERSYSAMHYNITSEGYYIPVSRVNAYVNRKGAYNELVEGYTVFEEIAKWKGKKKNELEPFIALMDDLKNQIINASGALVHFTAESSWTDELTRRTNETLQMLPSKANQKASYDLPVFTPNQAFTTPADVVYAVLGGNIYKAGLEYSGRLEVLRKYLDRDYLYNRIRVQGGAYGNFSRLSRFSGNLIFISYRDPNVAGTFKAFESIPQTLASLKISDYALEQIKISTYNSFDPLVSASQKGSKARNDYLSGLTLEDAKKTVDEILATTADDLRRMAEPFEKYMQNCVVSIIGSRDKIEREKARFSELISI